MREILKNRDLRRELACCAGAAMALAVLAGLWDLRAGLAALGTGAAFTLAYLLLARRRYRAMAELSGKVDRVLHGYDGALIVEHDEGELSILTTEVEKMTARLREQSGQLLAEKQELAQALEDIFHQVRTPLTALNLQTAMLAEREVPDERRLRLVREVRRELGRVEWLVESLLKLSRIEAGAVRFRKEPVLLRELVEKAAEPLAVSMDLRGQELRVTAGEERFTGDLSWTAEALGNLLKNCVEHAPEGGTIRVVCEENPLYTQLTVRDDGPGFAPEDLPHLFERFYRGRDAGDGSVGIGLALARRIVVEQGGSLTADDPPEGGARFTMRFNKCII